MLEILNAATRASLVMFLLCGIVYPLALTGFGQALFPFQSNGSLIRGSNSEIVGSRLIGQQWSDPKWFHGRLSATVAPNPSDPTKTAPMPYNASSSSGSNLGPTSSALEDRLLGDWKALDNLDPEATNNALPADMLTTSASGLDPDISPANALLQARQVARARSVSAERIVALVQEHVVSRSLGVFGEPRVNVLELNIALSKAFPIR
ncbi:MAG: potassium-transporting ATPase subunit KdpC [Methylocystis sp.]|jgi:K+-transporting ATPase ATPase C chain